jgi:hypothetical protein
LDCFAEFLSSLVKVFFLGKLDAPLHVVSAAAAAFRRFRSLNVNRCTTKNRYDRDGE